MKIHESLRSRWRKAITKWTNRILVQKWFDIGLRRKMSTLVIVGLVGLIAIFSYIAISSVRQTTQQLLDEHVLQARILAESLDSSLSHVVGVLTILSAQNNTSDLRVNIAKWGELLREDFPPIRGIYLLDANYQLLSMTPTAPAIAWNDVFSEENLDYNPTRIITSKGLPRPYVVVAIPITNPAGNQREGFIAAIINLSDPSIVISSGLLESDLEGNLQIINSQGKMLASSHPEQTLTADTIDKITEQLATNEQATVEACLGCSSNGLEAGTVIAYASLTQAKWGVLIWHDSRDLFAPVRIIAIRTLGLGMLTILGAIGLVILTTRSVITPVQALTDAAHKIGDSQIDSASLKTVECTLSTTLANESIRRRDEIGILANSFISMCNRLEQSMDEIQSWNRELDTRVQVRTQELSILNAVAMTVNQSLNLEEILDRALDEVIQLTGIDVIAIFIQDAGRGKLELQAYRGLSEEAARLAYQVGMLDSSCGGVVELGKTIVVPDISSYRGRGARSLQRENIVSIMHVPLTTKGCTIGSMCVGTHTAVVFNDEKQDLLTAIGNQIAIAVDNARLYADVQRKERVHSELFKKMLDVQEEERKRIAREMHDEISQSLTALLYNAEDGMELKQLGSVKKRLRSICDLSQHALDDVHKLIYDLRPSMLDQLGLVPALRWLSATHLEPKGIRVSVTTNTNLDLSSGDDHAHLMSSEIETALYRVIQEAINNISRHSAARNVEVKLIFNDGVASVTVTDDGIGFDVAEVSLARINDMDGNGSKPSENMRGLGLLGMQERIQLLGGEIEITSTPGSGTRIAIRVPTEGRNHGDD